MTASISALLVGSFLEELVDFILFRLSKADDVEVVLALGVGHMHNLPFEPTHSAQTKLAIRDPLVFVDPNGSVEDAFAPWEVETVLANVLAAFRLVSGRHSLIVATKSARGASLVGAGCLRPNFLTAWWGLVQAAPAGHRVAPCATVSAHGPAPRRIAFDTAAAPSPCR